MENLVVVDVDGNTRESLYEDLKLHHPKCNDCGNRKGIHGAVGLTSIFCQIWNKEVGKEEYCSKHTGKL